MNPRNQQMRPNWMQNVRLALPALWIAVLSISAGCGNQLLAPEEQVEARQENSDRQTLRILDEPGMSIPRWYIVDATVRVVAEYPSLQCAHENLVELPAELELRLAAGLDLDNEAAVARLEEAVAEAGELVQLEQAL